MDVEIELDAPCAAGRLFSEVDDLARYPSWLAVVRSVRPLEGSAWSVGIGARVGPFTRTKRLRMVRTHHDPPREVRFERAELDGVEHSAWVLEAWVLEAQVADGPAGSRLRMRLHHDGALGPLGPLVEQALRLEVGRARPRLLARLR